MRQITFKEYLEKSSTEKLRESLEDSFETLDLTGSMSEHFDKDEFIHEILEDRFNSDYSDYEDRCFDEEKDRRMFDD